MSDPLESLRLYWSCPAKALSISTRSWLSKHLNPELDSLCSNLSLLQDWRGVAEILEFQAIDIDNFAREKNPTMELLRQWAFRDTSTIGLLLSAIEAVERFEILKDDQLPVFLERDYKAYEKSICHNKLEGQSSGDLDAAPIQDPEVTSVDEGRFITVNEAITGVPEYFDAFICYTHQDFEFVHQMIHKLETVRGLKLCIISRDLMPGCAKYVIMAKLIQERCQKMIIVLSPDYINSKECEFQTRFAHSLAPGAKEKKLIPVIYRPCAIPSILNHICTVDFTRCDVVEWFWVRLANSLKSSQRSDSDHTTGMTYNQTGSHQSTSGIHLTSSGSQLATGRVNLTSSGSHQASSGIHLTNSCSPEDRSSTQSFEESLISRNSSSHSSLAESGSSTSWTDLSPNFQHFSDNTLPMDSSMEIEPVQFQMHPPPPPSGSTQPSESLNASGLAETKSRKKTFFEKFKLLKKSQ